MVSNLTHPLGGLSTTPTFTIIYCDELAVRPRAEIVHFQPTTTTCPNSFRNAFYNDIHVRAAQGSGTTSQPRLSVAEVPTLTGRARSSSPESGHITAHPINSGRTQKHPRLADCWNLPILLLLKPDDLTQPFSITGSQRTTPAPFPPCSHNRVSRDCHRRVDRRGGGW